LIDAIEAERLAHITGRKTRPIHQRAVAPSDDVFGAPLRLPPRRQSRRRCNAVALREAARILQNQKKCRAEQKRIQRPRILVRNSLHEFGILVGITILLLIGPVSVKPVFLKVNEKWQFNTTLASPKKRIAAQGTEYVINYQSLITNFQDTFFLSPSLTFSQIKFMPSPATLLTLSNVTKRYESPGNTNSLTVLDDISLQVDRGQSLAIVGPSGSGKSTLLQIIGTLDRPTSGTVQLDGQDLNQLNDIELAAVRNRKLGFVFQFHYLFF